MSFTVVLPNPFDPEGDNILLGDAEFETEEEAIEWASEILNSDEEGKIQVVYEYEEASSL
jgi:hypothetical protein